MKKTISMEELKVMLRETGVRVKPSYDRGTWITVSSALKDKQRKWLNAQANKNGVSSSRFINRMILNFKPIKKDVVMRLASEEAKSTAGFLGKRVGKIFGTRKNIKFSGYGVDKFNFNKLNDLSEYYGISRSAVIRFIIEDGMSK